MSNNIPAGRAVNLAGAIDYAADAVVSKTLVDHPAGTITVFAFDRGQGLSEHTAPFDAVVQALEGSAEILLAGRPAALSAGELFVMPAGVPHALRAVQRFKMLLIMIRQKPS